MGGSGWLFAGMLSLVVPRLVYADSILDVVAKSTVPWEKYKEKHGVAVERRAVKGSSFYEYRAVSTMPMAPAALIELMWSTVPTRTGPVVRKRQVLQKSKDSLLIYDQIKTPVVSDRDYTMRLRTQALGNERYEMTFQTANDEGPPLDPHYVRIPAISGRWLVEPEPGKDGFSHVTYQTYSEPGGSVPAFMISGPQFEQVIRSIENLAAHIKSEQATQAGSQGTSGQQAQPPHTEHGELPQPIRNPPPPPT